MNLTDKLAQKFDRSKTFKFSDINLFSEESAWTSTGSPYLDYRLRTLGYPTGIVEIRGDSQSGKTTLSIHAMIECLSQYKEKAVVVILSSERRDNKIYARQLGLKTEQVIVHRVKTMEDVFNKMKQTINGTMEIIDESSEKLKPRFLFVWDSLGQTVSAQEKVKMDARAVAKKEEDQSAQAAMGAAARALSVGLRDTISFTDGHDVTFYIINRAYDNISHAGKTSYGGKAITFYPNLRMELKRIQGLSFTQDGEEIGQITTVIPFKTDFANPKQKINIEIGYGFGVVLSKDDIEMGISAGILEKHAHGAKFMGGKLKWGTRRELYALYENKNPLLKILVKKLLKYAHDRVLNERAKEANE